MAKNYFVCCCHVYSASLCPALWRSPSGNCGSIVSFHISGAMPEQAALDAAIVTVVTHLSLKSSHYSPFRPSFLTFMVNYAGSGSCEEQKWWERREGRMRGMLRSKSVNEPQMSTKRPVPCCRGKGTMAWGGSSPQHLFWGVCRYKQYTSPG